MYYNSNPTLFQFWFCLLFPKLKIRQSASQVSAMASKDVASNNAGKDPKKLVMIEICMVRDSLEKITIFYLRR